jgi:deoxyribodipyrimidine photolyase
MEFNAESSPVNKDSHQSSPENDQNQLPILLTSQSFPLTASISLSLSTILPNPSQFFTANKLSALLASKPTNLKISSQISAIAHLSISTTSSPKLSYKSIVSANPLQKPLFLNPRRPSEPSNAAGIRRTSIVWFRNDLRVHDNECLNSANNESMSVLPVFCFDPTDYGKSSAGFDKTGPYRARFLIESVSNLRKNLQARGSDLVVKIGNPVTVLVELAKAIGAEAVYAHKEITNDEVKAENKIESAMKDEGLEVKYFWGSTLYHPDDLPFKLEEMPCDYGGFREKVMGLEVRKTIAALDQLRGLPTNGDVEPGEIPSLVDLGLNPSASLSQEGKGAANDSLIGGESEAMQRIKKFAAECSSQPRKDDDHGNNSIYGANFSTKVSPWLAMGCLSPRSMFDELKNTVSRTISAASNQKDGSNGESDGGMNWLIYELLWRDFFRFITKKYSTARQQQNAAPVTAYAGATA